MPDGVLFHIGDLKVFPEQILIFSGMVVFRFVSCLPPTKAPPSKEERR